MPEPTDLIIPILQMLQGDTADIKESLRSLDSRVGRLEVRIESMDNLMTYSLGLNARTKTEIDGLKKRMDVMEAEQRNS